MKWYSSSPVVRSALMRAVLVEAGEQASHDLQRPTSERAPGPAPPLPCGAPSPGSVRRREAAFSASVTSRGSSPNSSEVARS